MAVEGTFREDLDVDHLTVQFSVLKEFAQPGQSFTDEEITEQYLEITADPQPYGNGPLFASSSVALVCAYPPLVCHDVNGYYRALGVSHRATRKGLKEAYMARQGHQNEYLTYVMTKLLDPAVRRIYDLMPMGSVYMDDKYVQDAIKKAAFKEARRRRMAGHEATVHTVLAEWGFVEEENSEIHQEIPVHDEELSEPEVIFNEWAFAYYLWRAAPSEHQLKEWQGLLIREMARLGITIPFAVGIIGGEGHLYLNLEDRHIFFIDATTTPTPQIAADAVHTLIGNT